MANYNIGGHKNPKWNGGRRKDKDGYILIWSPYHPYRDGNNYVREHRLVVEESIRRFLLPEELVHHINGKKDDNRIDNLQVMSSSEHMSTHSTARRDRNFKCSCGATWHYGKGMCKLCYSKVWRNRNKDKVKKYNERAKRKNT